MESASYLFVYGTLMRRFEHAMHEFLLRYADYHCDGCYRGKLYRISWYPAVISSDDPQDEVHGEIYYIRDEKPLFSTLDDYEVCSLTDPASGEYVREIASVKTNEGECLDCHIYLYNRSLQNAQLIPTGRFRQD